MAVLRKLIGNCAYAPALGIKLAYTHHAGADRDRAAAPTAKQQIAFPALEADRRTKYSTGNKCEFWQTEPDAMQGGECAAVRALQAGANDAARRFWQPKTHLFLGDYLAFDKIHDRFRRAHCRMRDGA